MEDMERILRESEFSQRRLGLLVLSRAGLAGKVDMSLIPMQNEQLRAQYAELFGKIDETIAAEARYLTGLYSGVTDITATEAKCLTELLRAQSRGT